MNPLWLEIAKKEIGTEEIPGIGNNPKIIAYHQTTTLKATEDSVPWCSSFVNWCLKQVEIVGTNSAAAISWLLWGRKLDIPELGCICVIHKKVNGADPKTGSTSGYHVAFWLREDINHVWLLGGNQGDAVKEESFGLLNSRFSWFCDTCSFHTCRGCGFQALFG